MILNIINIINDFIFYSLTGLLSPVDINKNDIGNCITRKITCHENYHDIKNPKVYKFICPICNNTTKYKFNCENKDEIQILYFDLYKNFTEKLLNQTNENIKFYFLFDDFCNKCNNSIDKRKNIYLSINVQKIEKTIIINSPNDVSMLLSYFSGHKTWMKYVNIGEEQERYITSDLRKIKSLLSSKLNINEINTTIDYNNTAKVASYMRSLIFRSYINRSTK